MNKYSLILGSAFLAGALSLQLLPTHGKESSYLKEDVGANKPFPTLSFPSSSNGDTKYQEDRNYDSGYWKMTPRPFAVVEKSDRFEWTKEDGKRPDIIRQLAANPHEAKRMKEENAYVIRRQLVYLGPEFEKAVTEIYDGKLATLTLPGFDGEEIAIDIEEVVPSTLEGEDVGPLSGYFQGFISGDPEAIVDVGSFENSWSIRILNKEESYYQIESRGHNEFIIAEIDVLAMNQTDPTLGNCAGGQHIDNVGQVLSE